MAKNAILAIITIILLLDLAGCTRHTIHLIDPLITAKTPIYSHEKQLSLTYCILYVWAFLTKIISWFFSQEASNLGSFLAGLGTLAFGLFAIISYDRWKGEKRLEKKSEWAELMLKELYSFEIAFDDWLIHLMWVYSDNNLSHEKLEAYPFEIRNYEKKTSGLFGYLGFIKVHADFLDQDIPTLIETLERYIKGKRTSLRVAHFANSTKKQRDDAFKDLATPYDNNQMKTTIDAIRTKLKRYVFFFEK